MKRETFKAARARLLVDLLMLGWKTKPLLKVPQAVSPDGTMKLFFKPEAVHFESDKTSGDTHSLFVDIRGLAAVSLVGYARRF